MRSRGMVMLLLCAALLAGACDKLASLVGESPQQHAEKRVKFIFDAVQKIGEGNGLDYQAAVCRWFNDRLVPTDSGDFTWAYDEFNKFKFQGGLVKGFDYAIEGSRETEQSAGGEFVVYGTAHGKRFEVIVPERKALRWQVAPGNPDE